MSRRIPVRVATSESDLCNRAGLTVSASKFVTQPSIARPYQLVPGFAEAYDAPGTRAIVLKVYYDAVAQGQELTAETLQQVLTAQHS